MCHFMRGVKGLSHGQILFSEMNLPCHLEVSDNDNLVSEISVIIKSESSREGTYFSLTLLLFSIIFVSYAFYKRYSILEDEIPKW